MNYTYNYPGVLVEGSSPLIHNPAVSEQAEIIMQDFLHQQHLATPTEDSAVQLYSQGPISLDATSNTKSAKNNRSKYRNQNRSKTMDKFNTIHFQKVPSALRKTSNFAEAARRKIDMRTTMKAPTHDIRFERDGQLAKQQDQKSSKAFPNTKMSNQINDDLQISKEIRETTDFQMRTSAKCSLNTLSHPKRPLKMAKNGNQHVYSNQIPTKSRGRDLGNNTPDTQHLTGSEDYKSAGATIAEDGFEQQPLVRLKMNLVKNESYMDLNVVGQ